MPAIYYYLSSTFPVPFLLPPPIHTCILQSLNVGRLSVDVMVGGERKGQERIEKV